MHYFSIALILFIYFFLLGYAGLIFWASGPNKQGLNDVIGWCLKAESGPYIYLPTTQLNLSCPTIKKSELPCSSFSLAY